MRISFSRLELPSLNLGLSARVWFRSLVIFLSLLLVLGTASPAVAVSKQEVEEITQQWQTSAHALNDVNCASCHQSEETKE